MKSYTILLVAVIALLFTSCRDHVLDLKFGFQARDVSFKISPTFQAGEIVLDTAFQTLNLDSICNTRGADPGSIKSVMIKRITASIDSPATSNFDILDSGVIFISAAGLAPTVVSNFNNVPDGVKQFDILPNSGVDLLEFARKPLIKINGKLITNGPVTETTYIRFKIEYEVIARPFAEE